VPVTSGGVEITPTATVTEIPVTTKVIPPKTRQSSSNKAASSFVLMAFVGLIGFITLADPRPPEINRLANAIKTHNEDSLKKK
jgi:hypothetical protein